MKCYLDMDGLLCNLFDYIGQRIYGKDYKDVTPEEKQKARSIWTNKSEFYEKLGGVYSVFSTLEPYPTNDALIKKVIEKFGCFYICSHPTAIDRKKCIEGKEDWIRKYIVPKYGKYFKGAEFPDNKSVFATNADGTPNVLIDDFSPYVDAWNNKGGIAIRLQSSLHPTDKQIEDYLDQQLSNITLKESFKEEDFDKVEQVLENHLNDLIVFTGSDSIDLNKKYDIAKNHNPFKPYGLWYARGKEWFHFIRHEYRDPFFKYKNVFKITLKYKNILCLKNKSDVKKFSNMYSVDNGKGFELIDWVEVSKKYKGIEIDPYSKLYDFDIRAMWHSSWDVSSGCIWDTSAIASVEKIYS